MHRILDILNKEFGNLNQAAFLLGIFTFLSQVLALFRDRAIAHFIGPSVELDAYYAAFRIPDLIFISIASLASITVLIPFINSKMNGNVVTEEAKKFLNDTFTVFISFISVCSLIIFIFMPELSKFVTPGFNPEVQSKVVMLSRIMLLSPILMGLSSLFGTITQLFHKFFVYALSPLFYNLGIIIGVVFLYPVFGINGLAFGVVLGALMHFLNQLIASSFSGFGLRFSKNINFFEIKKVVLISLPRTLGLAFNNIALICIISLASFLKTGSISIFNLSFNLQSVPLNIFGVSYAIAAFPSLAKCFQCGNKKDFNNQLKSASRAIVFWTLPIIFLFIVLRAQIVRVILGSSTFSWDNTRLVAASLALFSISILAQSLTALFSRAYYASGNTRKPLVVNLLSSVSIVVFSFILTYSFEHFSYFKYFIESILKVSGIEGTGVLMLPLAYSIGTILNCILHLVSIKKDFLQGEDFVGKIFFQSLGASFFIGLVSYFSLNVFSSVFNINTFWGILSQGLFSGILGILAGVSTLYLLKNEEISGFMSVLKSKFWKAKVIVPSEENPQ